MGAWRSTSRSTTRRPTRRRGRCGSISESCPSRSCSSSFATRTTATSSAIDRMNRALAVLVLVLVVAAGCDGAAPPEPVAGAATDPVTNLDLRLVGRNDLQARSAYQPIVHAYGERRILFVGHHAGEALNPAKGLIERNGLSIVDVTDPARPTYLTHVPPTGTEASGTQHVQVCDGRALPNGDDAKVYAIRTNGAVSYEVLDVTNPAAPKLVTTIAETGTSSRPESERGNRETHKFQWDCATGIAYMNGTAAGGPV